MSVQAIRAGAVLLRERASVTSPAHNTKPRLSPPLDLQGLMHLAQMKRRDTQQSAAESDVRTVQGTREREMKEARAAQERAEREGAEAAESGKSAAFWKKCAAWAGAVAAVAATCCTMGSAAPLVVVAVGVALSVSSPYVGDAVGKATNSEKAGQWTAVGCMIAGAAIQFVGGGMSTGATGTVGAVAKGTQLVASGTAASATAAGGVREYEAKKHEANSQDARADALAARSMARRTQAEMDAVIDELRALEGSVRRALDAVAGIGKELNAGRERVASHLARST